MQVVQEEAGLERALKSCADRGRASFADARVYLERYVSQPRHIEVQVFGDRTATPTRSGSASAACSGGTKYRGGVAVTGGFFAGGRGRRDGAT